MTWEQARQIVSTCQNCHSLLPTAPLGVNPRGVVSNQIWQMDITHVPSFKKIPFVHVSLDTYSSFICASLQMGEADKHTISHCLNTVSFMGIPKFIKTDNGCGYMERAF